MISVQRLLTGQLTHTYMDRVVPPVFLLQASSALSSVQSYYKKTQEIDISELSNPVNVGVN